MKTFHILIHFHTKYLFVQFIDCNHLMQKCLYLSLKICIFYFDKTLFTKQENLMH